MYLKQNYKKKSRDLKIATQKKSLKAKLDQTIFELKKIKIYF